MRMLLCSGNVSEYSRTMKHTPMQLNYQLHKKALQKKSIIAARLYCVIAAAVQNRLINVTDLVSEQLYQTLLE